MKTTELGRTGIEVTTLCLGTMTWGSRQNDEADGHAQIDRALDAGINFMDTAEMYPVNPISAETVGNTERIIGNWLARGGPRDKWVIATKIAGINGGFVRPGQPITGASVREAVEQSLARLQTDYIDLYQLHWPNWGHYHFRQQWVYDPTKQPSKAEIRANMADVLGALDEAMKAGKIRAWGLSNDTAWQTMQWIDVAEEMGVRGPDAVQNEYSLLYRTHDTDWSEITHHEGVTLLAYSPLAAGVLTGKYQGGAIPENSRLSFGRENFSRATDRALDATGAYLEIAKRHGLHPVQMALAWCVQRPFNTIPIFGAVSLEQLDVALGADEVTLDQAVLDEITAAFRAHPMPF